MSETGGNQFPLAKLIEKQKIKKKKISGAFPLRGTDTNPCAIWNWIAVIHRSYMITNLPGVLLLEHEATGAVGHCTFYF